MKSMFIAATVAFLSPIFAQASLCAAIAGSGPAIISKWDNLFPETGVAPYWVAQRQLARSLAEKSEFIRRATPQEIQDAISSGQFPDSSALHAGAFVVQKKMSFTSPGKVVLYVNPLPTKKWNEDPSPDALEKELLKTVQTSKVIYQLSINKYLQAYGKSRSGFSDASKPRILFFADGTVGVFKHGTPTDCQAEVAAYRLSQKLKLNLVPPTVLANIDGRVGSLQLFIHSPFDFREKPSDIEKAYSLVSERDKSAIDIFYGVSGNWDRHIMNQTIDGSGGVALFDNAAMLRPQVFKYGEEPWIPMFKEGLLTESNWSYPHKVGSTKNFPFEKAKYYNNTEFEGLLETFRGRYNTAEVGRHFLFVGDSPHFRKLGLIEWQGYIWLQTKMPTFYPPSIPKTFPPDIIAALESVQLKDLAVLLSDIGKEFGWESAFDRWQIERLYERILAYLFQSRRK